MIRREHYIETIREFYDSDLIKIITGIRRCGKSVILHQMISNSYYVPTEITPSWLYDDNNCYWTMSSYGDSNKVFVISKGGNFALSDLNRVSNGCMVRPVIEIYKSASITKLDS